MDERDTTSKTHPRAVVAHNDATVGIASCQLLCFYYNHSLVLLLVFTVALEINNRVRHICSSCVDRFGARSEQVDPILILKCTFF